MLRNYIKTAFCGMLTTKLFTFLTLLGLAIAMTACYLALTYVNFELSYDTAPVQRDHIYRLITDEKTQTGVSYESASAAMGPALKADYPQVKSFDKMSQLSFHCLLNQSSIDNG